MGTRQAIGLTRGLRSSSLLLAGSLAAASGSLPPQRAHAAEVSASARAHARRLVGEGDQLYAQRDYVQALERYSEAYRLMHVPTVGVEVVKVQEALGQILEAAQTAREVSALPRQANEPAVFGDARLQAAQDALRLSALTPTLLLDVAPRGVLFSVQIDGVAPSGDSPFPLNPGPHRVLVSAQGYQYVETEVSLQQAERQTLTVTLFPLGRESAAVVPPAPPPASADAAVPAQATPARATPVRESSSTRTLGWVGIGVAGAGVAAGTFAGITALSKKPDCPGNVCRPDQQQEIDSSRRMGHIADVSFGVAILAGALGIWALASSTGDDGESAAASPREPELAGRQRVQLSAIDVAGDRDRGSWELRLSGSF
jgi:hypothetical protein